MLRKKKKKIYHNITQLLYNVSDLKNYLKNFIENLYFYLEISKIYHNITQLLYNVSDLKNYLKNFIENLYFYLEISKIYHNITQLLQNVSDLKNFIEKYICIVLYMYICISFQKYTPVKLLYCTSFMTIILKICYSHFFAQNAKKTSMLKMACISHRAFHILSFASDNCVCNTIKMFQKVEDFLYNQIITLNICKFDRIAICLYKISLLKQ
eukprot:TRINITY_DN29281_c0_g2_i1.p1 TRINITY_DN29281_c0_g2~~TRINITY_DN29281_c0_g2_i1.p1  ORF type:complete len:211 (-),score=-18.37 TRINITY_DN29281_c0_g2_i1:500-1132(-)